jgi:hypothetical protein
LLSFCFSLIHSFFVCLVFLFASLLFHSTDCHKSRLPFSSPHSLHPHPLSFQIQHLSFMSCSILSDVTGILICGLLPAG